MANAVIDVNQHTQRQTSLSQRDKVERRCVRERSLDPT